MQLPGDYGMLRAIGLALAGAAYVVAAAGHVQADVIITYQDVGSNLEFDYSGSLNVGVGPNYSGGVYATASLQAGQDPVFYSSSEFAFAGEVSSFTQTSGLFATNLPTFSNVQGAHSGTSFMFRVNDGNTTPSVDLWGDWGAANSAINGQLVLTGQSAAGIGMVDGWKLHTTWGSITFEAAGAAPVTTPEPSSLALFGIGTSVMGLAAARRRRREKN